MPIICRGLAKRLELPEEVLLLLNSQETESRVDLYYKLLGEDDLGKCIGEDSRLYIGLIARFILLHAKR